LSSVLDEKNPNSSIISRFLTIQSPEWPYNGRSKACFFCISSCKRALKHRI